jgi:CheY-like chemotaxis protein
MARREPQPRLVAVLNSNDDLVRLIQETLQDEGYLTMKHHIADLRDGNTDITRFFDDRDPPVIVYDLAAPFRPNWQFLQILRAHPSLKGRHVILTTNNAVALKEACGVDALQVVGSNKDLAALVDRVNAAFRAMPERRLAATAGRGRKL